MTNHEHGVWLNTVSLDEEAFKATLAEPMRDVTNDATHVLDIGPYVAAVPRTDLG